MTMGGHGVVDFILNVSLRLQEQEALSRRLLRYYFDLIQEITYHPGSTQNTASNLSTTSLTASWRSIVLPMLFL